MIHLPVANKPTGALVPARVVCYPSPCRAQLVAKPCFVSLIPTERNTESLSSADQHEIG